MDPHATWRDMQNALKDEDWDLAIELAEALLTWLKGGGFPPVIGDKDLPYGWHRKLAEAGATFVIIAAGLEQIDDEAEREKQSSKRSGGTTMMHNDRTWCLTLAESAEDLARKLTEMTWCCCTAFAIDRYRYQ